jgi:hypothetical protein
MGHLGGTHNGSLVSWPFERNGIIGGGNKEDIEGRIRGVEEELTLNTRNLGRIRAH